MRSLLTAGALLLPEGVLPDAWLLLEDGVIHSFGNRGDGLPQYTEHHELPGALLAPAMLDIHVHGAAGHDVMDGTADSVAHVSTLLAKHGVGAWLPTLVTAAVDRTLYARDGLATLIEKKSLPGAVPLGLHLEEAFISYAKRGVHAPIRNAASVAARVSLGHSNATAVQARAGIAAGGVSATPTYNAMRGLEHREPGMLGVVLDDQNLYAEIIADGKHVDPVAGRIFWREKGAARAILITDGLSATGMPEGHYTLGGFDVEVKGGVGWHEGIVAGSVLTMDRAVSNFASFTHAPLSTVALLSSANPAAMI